MTTEKDSQLPSARSYASELQLKVNCRSERYAEKNLVWLLVGRPAKMTRRK